MQKKRQGEGNVKVGGLQLDSLISIALKLAYNISKPYKTLRLLI